MINYFDNKPKFEVHPEWISEHINKHFDERHIRVFHEILSLDFHLDVYFINDPNRKYNILLTSGMSLMEMNIDVETPEKDNLRFGELMLLIPKNLTLDMVYTGKNKNDWVISMLKESAKFPHFYDTWLGVGHTIQANEEYEPYSDECNFYGVVLLPSATFQDEFTKIQKEDRVINLYSVFPLYKEEIEYKRKHGFSEFWKKLVDSNPREIIDLKRPSIIRRKSFWSR